jgi:hypothetical protein
MDTSIQDVTENIYEFQLPRRPLADYARHLECRSSDSVYYCASYLSKPS